MGQALLEYLPEQVGFSATGHRAALIVLDPTRPRLDSDPYFLQDWLEKMGLIFSLWMLPSVFCDVLKR
jgi:hypothetical protein